MSRYWLCLGSNLGDRADALQHGVDALAHEGVVVQAVSAVYETAPQDVEDQPPFLNAVAVAESQLDPSAVLAAAKRVERAAGRDLDGLRYGPRPIDIDLLLWDGGVFEADDPHLVVPHLRLAERRFVLVPLLDVDPALTLPDGTPIAALAEAIVPATQPVSRTDYPLVVPHSAAPGL